MRTSEVGKATKALWKQLEEDIQASKMLAIESKWISKVWNNSRIVKLVQECSHHGGPITGETISLLDNLNL